MRKIKNNIWEKIFIYPSFKTRFNVTVIFSMLVLGLLAYLSVFKFDFIQTTTDRISTLNLLVQSATLLLAIFAAYYALRQLVETRFTNLEETGMREYKRQHYSRAFNKWKEALYVRPEISVFSNLCESLLLMEDFETFDEYIKKSEGTTLFGGKIFELETSDRIVILLLKSTRNLLVKNQGQAEIFLNEVVSLVKGEGSLVRLDWDFIDLQTSRLYQDLSGECRIMLDNLISYLQKTMPPTRKTDFEAGNFATQISEPSTVVTPPTSPTV